MIDIDDDDAIRRYVETADEYFRDIADPEALFDKPYVPREASASNVIRLGYLLAHLQHGAGHTVLDFGAGMGWLTIVLARMGCRVIALDVSPTALRYAEEAYRRARLPPSVPVPRFVVYDGRRFPIEAGAVDRIACYDAMHHVPNKRTVLREMHRVLRPGGLACFVEPGPGHAESPDARHEVERWGVLEDEIDVGAFCEMARECGFSGLYAVPLVLADQRMDPQAFLRLHRGTRDRVLDWRGNDALVTACRGEYVADSRRPGRLHAQVDILDLPASVAPADELTARVQVTNTGDTRWLPMPGNREVQPVEAYRRHIEANGLQGLVALGVHLYDLQFETAVDRDYARGYLPRDIAPGDTCAVRARFRAPDQPGLYGLEFDMVDEYVAWFGDLGSPLTREYLRVDGPGVPPDSRSPDQLAARLVLLGRDAPGVLIVEAFNGGNTLWLAGPLARGGHVQVAAQRLDDDGRLLERDWVRVPLPRSVPPGQSVAVRLDLSAATRGVEVAAVLIDLVSEQRCWFGDGSRQLRVNL